MYTLHLHCSLLLPLVYAGFIPSYFLTFLGACPYFLFFLMFKNTSFPTIFIRLIFHGIDMTERKKHMTPQL